MKAFVILLKIFHLGFTKFEKRDIIKKPNKLNMLNGVVLFTGEVYLFFAALNFLEFGKNANSAKLGVAKGFFLVRFQLVWRQLEFAFFGALTSVGAPFIFAEK